MSEKDGNLGEGGMNAGSVLGGNLSLKVPESGGSVGLLIPEYQQRIHKIIDVVILAKVENEDDKKLLKRRWEGICNKFFETLLADSFSETNLGYIVHGGMVIYTDFQNILMEVARHCILQGKAPEDFLLLMKEHPEVFLRKTFILSDPEIQKRLRERLAVLEDVKQDSKVNMIEVEFLNPKFS